MNRLGISKWREKCSETRSYKNYITTGESETFVYSPTTTKEKNTKNTYRSVSWRSDTELSTKLGKSNSYVCRLKKDLGLTCEEIIDRCLNNNTERIGLKTASADYQYVFRQIHNSLLRNTFNIKNKTAKAKLEWCYVLKAAISNLKVLDGNDLRSKYPQVFRYSSLFNDLCAGVEVLLQTNTIETRHAAEALVTEIVRCVDHLVSELEDAMLPNVYVRKVSM